MKHSENYNLNLPEKADQFNIDDWNENTNIIDFELKKETDNRQSGDDLLLQKINQEINDRQSGDTDAKNLANATGILALKNGGTGASTKKEAEYNIIGDINEMETSITDTSKIVFGCENPNKTDGSLFIRKMSLVWNYIKEKISSALGLTENNYNGISDKAIKDENGNNIANTYSTKSVATTDVDGLMSSSDKSKLDSIESGANAYSLPQATKSNLGGVKVVTSYPTAIKLPSSQTSPSTETVINVTDSTNVSTIHYYKRSASQSYPKIKIYNKSSEVISVGYAESSSSFDSSYYSPPLIFGNKCNLKKSPTTGENQNYISYNDVVVVTPGESMIKRVSTTQQYQVIAIFKNGKMLL